MNSYENSLLLRAYTVLQNIDRGSMDNRTFENVDMLTSEITVHFLHMGFVLEENSKASEWCLFPAGGLRYRKEGQG